MKLEKELVAQLWRLSWDDIQISNFDKVLRSGSKLTLSLVSTNTQADTCTHTHTFTYSLMCGSTERIKLRLSDDKRWKLAGFCKDGLLQGQFFFFRVVL